MILQAVTEWAERERLRGFIGLRLSVRQSCGITLDKVAGELLAAEDAIARGDLRKAPQATSSVPPHVGALMQKVAL